MKKPVGHLNKMR